jgi:cytochrome c biogenesis protein CcdA
MVPFVLSLGLADSINPVTIAVALYLAATPNPGRRLAGYVAGVFAIYLVGGLVLLFGPASLLHLLTHGVDPAVGRVIALVLGVGSLAAAAFVWSRRDRMGKAALPERALHPGSTLALGGALTLVDLPTAFPLFIVVGAIVHEDLAAPAEATLIALYCAAYALPLVAILALRTLGGPRAEKWLDGLRKRASRWAPAALAVLSLVIGVVLLAYAALS